MILNVLDEHRNYEIGCDGVGVSGYWWRPSPTADVIRVYFDRNGLSVAGGPIRARKLREDGRTIIYFDIDPKEADHPRPSEPFQRSGWVKTTT